MKEFNYVSSTVCVSGEKEEDVSYRLSKGTWMMGGPMIRLLVEKRNSIYYCWMVEIMVREICKSRKSILEQVDRIILS